MCVCVLRLFSCVRLFATLWIIACQAPRAMEFSRQEYWSRVPFPAPRGLPDPEIEPRSPASPLAPSGKPHMFTCVCVCVCVCIEALRDELRLRSVLWCLSSVQFSSV